MRLISLSYPSNQRQDLGVIGQGRFSPPNRPQIACHFAQVND
jgi:hypothetical protein